MTDLSCTDYSEKSVVVRGDTKEHKEELKKLGGKWNGNLQGGGGWIFSKKCEDKVLAYIASGKLDDAEPAGKSAPATKGISATKGATTVFRSDVLSSIESVLLPMSHKERLSFISSVMSMADKLPIVVPKVSLPKVEQKGSESDGEEEVKKPAKIIIKKQPVKTVLAESDVDSDDEPVPQKRLLK